MRKERGHRAIGHFWSVFENLIPNAMYRLSKYFSISFSERLRNTPTSSEVNRNIINFDFKQKAHGNLTKRQVK